MILSMYLRNRGHKLNMSKAGTLPADSICIRIIVHQNNARYYYYLCKDIIYRRHYSNVVNREFTFIMEFK